MSVTFLSDVGTAQLIEKSEEDFNNAVSIIETSISADLTAIREVEHFLNTKGVFLEARTDLVHWEQDLAHNQTRFHFVYTDKRDGQDGWSASDARYVRTRLAELVRSLALQLQGLKSPC
jgi:hypothetical protein